MISAPVNPPRTYAEWVAVLDMLKNRVNDEGVLSAMQRGTIEWQSGVAERFTQKLVSSVNARLNAAIDKFQREIGRGSMDERVLVQSIIALRKELSFLVKTVSLPAIPETTRQSYIDMVKAEADKIQKSLEDSAKKDRTGKLTSILRNNRVNTI